MSNCTLKHMCFILLLSLCVGLSHGRRKPSKNSLERDIEIYRKMTKRIKQELEEYYDEYADGLFGGYNFDENKNKQSNTHLGVRKYLNYTQKNIDLSSEISLKGNRVKPSHQKNFTDNISHRGILKNKNILPLTKKWPKFEDILLAIGKKYDWKNDRWIKVKHKDKTLNKAVNSRSNKVQHQKHNFVYRIVKLNNAKSKRNVIAITAVR